METADAGAMDALTELFADIDARVQQIRSGQPDWPCARGCDDCCHQLAGLPRLSTAEWMLLQQGLERLPAQVLAAVRQRLAALAEQPAGPYVCPLLETQTGACSVYPQRPVACRSYGFYVQRDKGLYCGRIRTEADAGRLDEVVWGNHDRVDARLAGLGDSFSLLEWFARWSEAAAQPRDAVR